MKKMKTQLLHLLFLLCCLPVSATTLSIGSGTSTSGVFPLNTCYGYNYSQSIYLAGELVAAGAIAGTPGFISSIQYNQTTTSSIPARWKDWVVYMGNTTATSFTTITSWLPAGAMTKVFDGTVTPSGTGWYTITFSTPFYWDGISNIVIAIDENTAGYSCTSYWQTTNIGSAPDYRSIMYRNDRINPDPFSPPTAGTRGALIPNIQLNYNPAVSCSGTPTGGTATGPAAPVCPGTTATITISGATAAIDLSYSWEYATTVTGPWTALSDTTEFLTISPPACTGFYYRRQTRCPGSGRSSPSTAVLLSASCIITPPYNETFESITAANELPACMSASRLSDYVRTYLSATGSYNQTNHTPGGNKYASFRYSSDDYLFTPQIRLAPGVVYDFSFWYVTDGSAGWNVLEAKMGNSPVAAAMTTLVGGPILSPANIDYKQFKGRLPMTTGGVYYIGIHCTADSGPDYLSIDDIQLQEVPPCNGKPAAGISASEPSRICGTGTVQLDLPDLAPALDYAYQWQDSTAGGRWGTGAGRPSAGGSTKSFTTGLISANTGFRCIVTCLNTGDTAISAPVFIHTGAEDLPYNEDFEDISYDDQLPDCMTRTNIGMVYTATTPLDHNRQNNTPGGSKYAYFKYESNDSLTTPGLNLKAGYRYSLSFWYSADGDEGWDTLGAFIRSGSGPFNISLKQLHDITNTTYIRYTDTFSVDTSGIYYAGIRCYGTFNPWYLNIDDISIQSIPCSGIPDAGVLSGTVPSGTLLCKGSPVTLKSSGAERLVQGISYQWQRQATGSSIWNDIPGATDTIYSTDTAIGWTYRFAVNCSNSGITTFSALYALPTYPPHPPVSILTGSDTVHFCIGDTIVLHATPFPGDIYTWKIADEEIPGWKFDDLTATDSGVYTVEVISATTPCIVRSSPVYLIGNDPGFSVGLLTPADSFLCEDEKLLLKSSAAPGLSLQWQRNNRDIPGATAADYEITATGFYRVKASRGSGCPAVSRTIPITVDPVPKAIITSPGSVLTACSNEGLQLDASRGKDYLYQWSRNGKPVYGLTDSSIIVKDDGTYTVRIRYPSGCTAVSPDVSVTILPSPAPDIFKSDLILHTTGGSFKTYQWYRNDNLMPGHTADTLHLWYNGRYTVAVTAANGCSAMSPAFDVSEKGLSIPGPAQQDIRIYPNPVRQEVTLKVPVPFKISIKDISGRTLLEADDLPVIDMTPYADGIYLFTIRDKQGSILEIRRISKRSE